jgi:hypothetical protein
MVLGGNDGGVDRNGMFVFGVFSDGGKIDYYLILT